MQFEWAETKKSFCPKITILFLLCRKKIDIVLLVIPNRSKVMDFVIFGITRDEMY